jgi:hypothetical protein
MHQERARKPCEDPPSAIDAGVAAALYGVLLRALSFPNCAGHLILTIVSPAAMFSRAGINAAGEWIDQLETVSMNDLFDRMSTQELEA